MFGIHKQVHNHLLDPLLVQDQQRDTIIEVALNLGKLSFHVMMKDLDHFLIGRMQVP